MSHDGYYPQPPEPIDGYYLTYGGYKIEIDRFEAAERKLVPCRNFDECSIYVEQDEVYCPECAESLDPDYCKNVHYEGDDTRNPCICLGDGAANCAHKKKCSAPWSYEYDIEDME